MDSGNNGEFAKRSACGCPLTNARRAYVLHVSSYFCAGAVTCVMELVLCPLLSMSHVTWDWQYTMRSLYLLHSIYSGEVCYGSITSTGLDTSSVLHSHTWDSHNDTYFTVCAQGGPLQEEIAAEVYEDELDLRRSRSNLNSSITSAWSEHSLDPDDIRVRTEM
ncbi:hypothetical protein AB205_0124600 [Aquarana catesbeiana]|uniref:Uncharacterized protein n=1 Tax=Aquarana catesbeiana TaxID=8400 RepID=A0A2G9SIZ7_AQUCT|nr:hypothetical protein AB205_0124600 [Aquarana catesbeiana]